MVEKIDLAFCLECTSSMTCDLNQVRNMISAIVNPLCAQYENTIRMSLIQFRSLAHHDTWLTKTYTYTLDSHIFNQWLNSIETFGGNVDECEAVGKRNCFC